jgi:glycosyltransferase involved in cell wall biosynthesis
MNCIVSTEERFVLHQGNPASHHHLTYENFWRRYSDVFESIIVVGRLLRKEDSSAIPLEKGKISLFSLPGYIGPWQYLQHLAELKRKIHLLLTQESKAALILRLPGAVGGLIWEEICATNRPYSVEVVGDPYDVFAPGAVTHPLRPFFRWWFPHRLKQQCTGASATAYVTESALQHRYPPLPSAFSTHYSSVYLPDSFFTLPPKSISKRKKSSYTLINVGTMGLLYKGQDVLIDAVAACVAKGSDLRLVLAGDGRYRQALEARANALGLNGRVHFPGQIPSGEGVQQKLNDADLFVLPSRQEGLPRALIEAMARGLPCIGSTVGGIPELLPHEDLVPPDDVKALRDKICEVLVSPERMTRMSVLNREKAKEYREQSLRERRIEFYQKVREVNERWLVLRW